MKNNNNDPARKLVLATCAATLFTATTMLTPAAIAANKEQANLSYSVYIGASKMFKIGFVTTLTAKSYQSYMKLKPKGLAKMFANITMEMSAEGSLQKNSLKPAKFSFYRKKKKRKRTSSISWVVNEAAASMPSTNRTYKVSPAKQAILTKAINPGVPDPLSAFLRMGITDAKAPCSKSQRIYDGSKVYDLKFKLLGKSIFGAKSSGAYKGPAFKCQLNHVPVAGYSDKDLAKFRKNPVVFTIWFAAVKSAILKKEILLPVAATGKVKGRAFSAIANRAIFAGKPL